MKRLGFAVVVALTSLSTAALADDAPAEAADPPAGAETEAAPPAKPAEPEAAAEKPAAPPPAEEDDVRFRGGVALEGGLIAVPEVSVNLGAIGVNGQIGVQINDLVGVYAVPGFDVAFGELGGVVLSAALLVDFTFGDLFTVGVGPDVGVLAAIGADEGGAAALGGVNYGARLHLAVHPVFGEGEGGRRKAFSIGLDTRFLGGPVGSASVGPSGSSASVTGFLLQPMLNIGYTAM